MYDELIARLYAASGSDRRLDSEVTATLVAPINALVDERPGLDGWDIIVAGSGEEADVWREADDILNATQFLDAAVELLEIAVPHRAGVIFRRALSSIVERGLNVEGGLEMASYLARQLLLEAVREKAATQESHRAAA